MKRLLFYFQQVGGANALWPLIECWSPRFEIVVAGRPSIRGHLERKAGMPLPAISFGPDVPPSAWLRRHVPDILITDTIDMARASDARFGRQLWAAAGRMGIPSLAYVDCWWGYRERFTVPGEREGAGLPDRIAVIDRTAAGEAGRLGFLAGRVRVLGSPLFAELRSRRAAMTSEARGAARGRIGIDPDAMVLLYVSQPFTGAFGCEADWGFGPVSVFADMLDCLGSAGADILRRLRVVLLLHPEDPGEDAFRAATPRPGVAVDVRRGGAPHDYLLAADLVCGSFSILLTEAVLLGVPVISLQPGLRREDIAITNRVGATVPVRTAGQMTSHFLRAVVDDDYRRGLLRRQDRFRIVTDGRDRWRREIESLLTGGQGQCRAATT